MVCALILASGAAYADTYDFAAPFTTTDQSMWGPGSAVVLEDHGTIVSGGWGQSRANPITNTFDNVTPFLVQTGTTPNPIPGLPALPTFGFRDFGTRITGSTYGSMGLSYDYSFDSGSVNVSMPISARLDIPKTIAPGVPLVISSSFMPLPGASMTTNFPQASVALNFDYQLYARLTAQGCDKGCSPAKTIFNLDTGPKSFKIIGLDSTQNLSSSLTLDKNTISRERDPSTGKVVKTSVKPSLGLVNVGEVNVGVPDINTHATATAAAPLKLKASGEDDLIDFRLDVDTVMMNAAGLPNLLDPGVYTAGPVSGGYSLINIGLGAALAVTQSFEFNARPKVVLDLGFGAPIVFALGDTVTIDVPAGIAPGTLLSVRPTFVLDNTFLNDTGLRIDPTGDISFLGYTGRGDFPFPADSLDFDISRGPLGKDSFRVAGPGVGDLYANEFTLAFDGIAGDTITVRMVPEPSAWLMLCAGLALVGWTTCKRRTRLASPR
jgi:hypothetical protein